MDSTISDEVFLISYHLDSTIFEAKKKEQKQQDQQKKTLIRGVEGGSEQREKERL